MTEQKPYRHGAHTIKLVSWPVPSCAVIARVDDLLSACITEKIRKRVHGDRPRFLLGVPTSPSHRFAEMVRTFDAERALRIWRLFEQVKEEPISKLLKKAPKSAKKMFDTIPSEFWEEMDDTEDDILSAMTWYALY
jgi:hypothetical protein